MCYCSVVACFRGWGRLEGESVRIFGVFDVLVAVLDAVYGLEGVVLVPMAVVL